MSLRVEFRPPGMTILLSGQAMGISTGTPIAREYVGGDPYEGSYTITPLASQAVILPTTNKILRDDITVTKVPYYETSNLSGTTVFIASGV